MIHSLAHLILAGLAGLTCAHPAPAGVSSRQLAYQVHNLPGVSGLSAELLPEMYAGQLDTTSNNTGLFFWRFGQAGNVPSDDLIVWFNGGPGCSSMDGAMMEIGPFRPKEGDAKTLEWNQGTWLDSGDLLFVDQPAGTGFAFTDDGDYDSELTSASDHIVTFFKRYLAIFPEDAKKRVWIAGESYAGQYIPYFADALLKEAKKTDSKFQLNIAGLLIGNGWIEPDIQALSYVPFAMQNGLIGEKDDLQRLLRQHEKCQNAINDKTNTDFEKEDCERILDVLGLITRRRDGSNGGQGTCYNVYDYRKQDSYPACGANWPEILPETTSYLNLEGVQEALNIKHGHGWEECNNKVGQKFSPKTSAKSIELLPSLLKEVPIMLFNGDKDIICNHLGTEMMIGEVDIGTGKKGFSNGTDVLDWIYNGEPVGTVQTELNLTYVKVYNSSHMVPYDLPEVSRGLLDIMFQLKTIKRAASVVTPVHDVSRDLKSGGDGINHRAVEIAIVVFAVVDLVFIYKYFASQKPPRSSLRGSNSSSPGRANKRVHWPDSDEHEDWSEDGSSSNNSPSVLNRVLSRLGYNEYQRVDKDIELGDMSTQAQQRYSDERRD